ncbi:MAG: terpene cyclase/mutase family protein [Candidatus Competibacteraceae bacterium]|nr:terpene cyclase/mutase family protein [Candidatus Competibacteraceae bacterium]
MTHTILTKTPPVSVKEIWSCFRLQTHKGRQYWEFQPTKAIREEYGLRNHINWQDENAILLLQEIEKVFTFDRTTNPNSSDRVYRTSQQIPEYTTEENEIIKAFEQGVLFYSTLQTPDGNWPGDYGGPMFLLPGLVVASHITSQPIPEPFATLIVRYLLNHQLEDGGWGLHIEGTSTMFGTVMQYVSLRLLGKNADEPYMQKARTWIHQHGGATYIPSWGKFYLSLLGAYEWEGCHTLMPELWLLPKWSPIHPWRYWCHTRMVYLPMSYCYGHKITGPITTLIKALREELYLQPYDNIKWKQARNRVCETDEYTKKNLVLRTLYQLLNTYEKFHLKHLRRNALKFTLNYIDIEDKQTHFINIGPVNKVINTICIWHARGAEHPDFIKHVGRWKDYLWVAEDGAKMNGYNGSQLWDTAFAAQAMLEFPQSKIVRDSLHSIYHFIELSQIKEDPVGTKEFFRHRSKGGWPFSTIEHGWPITDCTAEGLKVSLKMHAKGIKGKEEISKERLVWAAEMLLSFQNADGGWASYEKTRAPKWLEWLNPAEVFGDIMIDYSYVECSSASMQALAVFATHNPHIYTNEIKSSLQQGAAFIRSIQRNDGSWLGSWAVCFTYATWFGVEGLIAAGAKTYENGEPDIAIKKACEFIASKQESDGGWGESYESCVQKTYIRNTESQVINTSWALLTLMAASYPDKPLIRRGIQFLMQSQLSNGDWPQQSISGVFNFNCMITYTSYRNVFPLWAIGRYISKYETKKIQSNIDVTP